METAVLNPQAVFDCICVFSSYCDRKGQQYTVEYYLLYLESVKEYSEGKIQLLHLNITSHLWCKFFSPIKLVSVYGNWRRNTMQSSIVTTDLTQVEL